MNKLYRGFTLIELVISMSIIAITLIGVLMAINTSTLYSSDPLLTHQAIAIAESYLEEIVSKAFPIGTCPAGTRSTYTNICNYNGLSESPRDQNGNPIAALASYNVSVSVDSTTASLGFPSLTSGTQVVRIDVTVSHTPNMVPVTFSMYRTNY